MSQRVGVVLAGCGYLDGTEITEAVSVLIALDRRGATVTCMAPAQRQSNLVNHATAQPCEGSRDLLEEAARIARGKVVDIASIHSEDLDALIFPGGFGAAKNLSDFAQAGFDCTVHPQVQRLILAMYEVRKPMGFACIAPVLAARVLGKAGAKPKLTIGTDGAVASAIHAMGGEHHDAAPTGVVVDEHNRLVSTPCYMNDVSPWIVYQGAERLVEEVLRLTGDDDVFIRRQMANSRR